MFRRRTVFRRRIESHRSAVLVAAATALLTGSAVVVLNGPAVATAAHDAAACSDVTDGALTWPVAAAAPQRCTAGRWQPVTDPYPFSDRWVSPGPSMALRGGARPNPAIEPGTWTATPLDPAARCRAEQVSVTYGKVDGPPRVDESAPGRPLTFDVIPRLLEIDMSGTCLWQKVGD